MSGFQGGTHATKLFAIVKMNPGVTPMQAVRTLLGTTHTETPMSAYRFGFAVLNVAIDLNMIKSEGTGRDRKLFPVDPS